MRLIPVLDLAGGRAVHARGGQRSRYAPVESVLAPGRPGDACALAQAYRSHLGAGTCYVADLDAIQGAGLQRGLLTNLAREGKGFGPGTIVDAGVHDVKSARELLDLGAEMVAVGLESLTSFDQLDRITAALGSSRVVFSLDLRAGTALAREGLAREAGGHSPRMLARRSGARTVLVLDLARVGTGAGVDVALVAELKRDLPDASVWVGGGVGDTATLGLLRSEGCSAALVASAVHSGLLGPREFAGES
jgi:phosphoribosylformimino-5-aminoimidazole carboxamide ribotide isomerase